MDSEDFVGCVYDVPGVSRLAGDAGFCACFL